MAPRAPDDSTPDVERSGLDPERTFVAVIGDRIVGVASYIVHDAELGETASLAVDPNCDPCEVTGISSQPWPIFLRKILEANGLRANYDPGTGFMVVVPEAN